MICLTYFLALLRQALTPFLIPKLVYVQPETTETLVLLLSIIFLYIFAALKLK